MFAGAHLIQGACSIGYGLWYWFGGHHPCADPASAECAEFMRQDAEHYGSHPELAARGISEEDALSYGVPVGMMAFCFLVVLVIAAVQWSRRHRGEVDLPVALQNLRVFRYGRF
ncbi:hypothetical protein GGR56DRAFT_628958 [Xylariaceae sp. FL0804]|nr:hypothetical protein GGR56DRAFT_628958 [Xylariaceae sp. FL0804]